MIFALALSACSIQKDVNIKSIVIDEKSIPEFIVAGEFAKQIKATIPELGKSIVQPTKAIGENSDGSLMFTVNSEGKFECADAYWTKYEQEVLNSLKK